MWVYTSVFWGVKNKCFGTPRFRTSDKNPGLTVWQDWSKCFICQKTVYTTGQSPIPPCMCVCVFQSRFLHNIYIYLQSQRKGFLRSSFEIFFHFFSPAVLTSGECNQASGEFWSVSTSISRNLQDAFANTPLRAEDTIKKKINWLSRHGHAALSALGRSVHIVWWGSKAW